VIGVISIFISPLKFVFIPFVIGVAFAVKVWAATRLREPATIVHVAIALLPASLAFVRHDYFSFVTFLPVGFKGDNLQKALIHLPSVSGAPHSAHTSLGSSTIILSVV
jgi:hypothetical protein